MSNSITRGADHKSNVEFSELSINVYNVEEKASKSKPSDNRLSKASGTSEASGIDDINHQSSVDSQPENHQSDKNDQTENLLEDHKSTLACSKCGATKVAKSRAKGLDSIIIRFLPRRPYRCLRCYHRFWAAESFTADKRRKESYVAVGILVLVLLAMKFLFNGEEGQRSLLPQGETRESIGSIQENATRLDTSSLSTSSVTSTSVADPDSFKGESSSLLNPAEDTAQFEQQRDAVLDSGFTRPQRQPQTELVLSKQELTQRLEAAKLRAEHATRVSEQKQLALKNNVNSSDTEALSLLKVSLGHRIEQWRRAWQAGESDAYMSFYSGEFRPVGGLTKQQWRTERLRRVAPAKNIVLEFSQFDVEFSDDNTRSVTTFSQRYVSNNYLEESRKELVLQMENKQWFIVSERSL